MRPEPHRLVEEVLSKSSVLWVRTPEATWPVWFVADGGTAYVVSGTGEQTLPPLPEQVTLLLRSKESRARVLELPATARRVTPAQEQEWATATGLLSAGRLNADVLPSELPALWAERSLVQALVPQPDPAAAEHGAPDHYRDQR